MANRLFYSMKLYVLLVISILAIIGILFYSKYIVSAKSDANIITLSDEESYTITSAGTYTIQGSTENGTLIINSNGDVVLCLDNASIQSEGSAAIYIKAASSVTLTSTKGSENKLISTGEMIEESNLGIDAAVYSCGNLILDGEGEIQISCEGGHGILSKKDLTVSGGSYTITANGSALKSKKDLTVNGGALTLSAENDGIHADGSLIVNDGSISVLKSYEGLEGKNITINGGDISVVSSDDGFNAADGSTSDQSEYSDQGGNAPDGMQAPPDGFDFGGRPEYFSPGNNDSDESGPESSMQAPPDGFDFGSSPEGFHAGNVNPNENGSENGMQAPPQGGFGGMSTELDEDVYLEINGGTIYVDADGDGLDSNGYFTINGGTVIVEGPSTGANGALDSGDGTSPVVNGGSIIALGTSSMAENFGEGSSQGAVCIYLDNNAEAGAQVELINTEGQILYSYTPSKSFDSVVISTADLVIGQSYTVTVGEQSYDFTMDEITYQNGNTFGGFGRR